jgi:hypothetical protein
MFLECLLIMSVARIPTLAPHFGVGMLGQNNAETQAVPIIGLDNSDIQAADDEFKNLTLGGEGTFAATQPPKLVRIIANELSIQDYMIHNPHKLVDWTKNSFSRAGLMTSYAPGLPWKVYSPQLQLQPPSKTES